MSTFTTNSLELESYFKRIFERTNLFCSIYVFKRFFKNTYEARYIYIIIMINLIHRNTSIQFRMVLFILFLLRAFYSAFKFSYCANCLFNEQCSLPLSVFFPFQHSLVLVGRSGICPQGKTFFDPPPSKGINRPKVQKKGHIFFKFPLFNHLSVFSSIFPPFI